MKSVISAIVSTALLVALTTSFSCSRGDGLNRVPLTGILTIQGQPLANATVFLIPANGTPGDGAIGTTDSDGKFQVISSRQSHTGAPAGEYTVRVSRLVLPNGDALPTDATEADYPQSRESIPRPYNGVNSTLKTTISAQGGEIKIDIPVALNEPKPKK